MASTNLPTRTNTNSTADVLPDEDTSEVLFLQLCDKRNV